MLDNVMQKWKQPAMLLTAVGISGLGNFIYLVAINILIYDRTGSAVAVALLWVEGSILKWKPLHLSKCIEDNKTFERLAFIWKISIRQKRY